jgi:hypothetical protein
MTKSKKIILCINILFLIPACIWFYRDRDFEPFLAVGGFIYSFITILFIDLSVKSDDKVELNNDDKEILLKDKELRDHVGLVDFYVKLGGSPYHPEQILEKVVTGLDFIGHGASKWTNQEKKLDDALKRIKTKMGYAKFLIYDLRSGDCSIDEKRKIYRSISVLYRLAKKYNTNYECVQIKIYKETPSFRLAFINGNFAVVGHYNGYNDNSIDCPVLVFDAKGEWSYYSGFKYYFTNKWEQATFYANEMDEIEKFAKKNKL